MLKRMRIHKKELNLDNKETEMMVVSKKATPGSNCFTDVTKLRQRQSFKYLGTLIRLDDRCQSDSEVTQELRRQK